MPGLRLLPAVLAMTILVLQTVRPALAADPVVLTLTNNRFVPNEVTVPAGERLRIEVRNQDGTPAEFESHDLRVEKFIAPQGQIAVMVGPLKPGTYKFFDDYHPKTATGTLTAVMKSGSE